MLKPSYLYRNARSGELLELFLVSAVSSLLITRFILQLSGYPSIGGRSLHIAHMLWGGLLMAAAQVLLYAFIGFRVQRLASVVGGIGFGLFIDELGKFITRDNNYFFRPTIGIIYLVFVGLFLMFRSLARRRRLTEREYLLNAVMLTEEAVINDLDEPERKRVLTYLSRSGDINPLVPAIRHALGQIKPVEPDDESILMRYRHWIEHHYRRIINNRAAVRVIDAVFVIKAAVFLVTVGGGLISLLEHESLSLASGPVLQFVSTAVSAGLIITGVVRIRRSRLAAYELFVRSLLLDIFVTQFFAFYNKQFGALPGFMLNVALYIALRFLLQQERRLWLREHKSAPDPHAAT